MNTLSVDPNDARWRELVALWEDGGEYDVTIHVRQTAPGEFDVTSLAESESPEEAAAPGEETAMPPKPGGKMPAVAIVMAAGKKPK